MVKSVAAQSLVAGIILVSFGVGCGSSTGAGGCGGFTPLPTINGSPAPAPLGLPTSQVIEGGLQARITKPGMDKLLSTITNLISGTLQTGICVPPQDTKIGITCFDVDVGACKGNGCNGGTSAGCPIQVALTDATGTDNIAITVGDGSNPVIHIDAKFDIHVPLELDYGGSLFCASANGSCILDVASKHWNGGTGSPIEILADIATGIDSTTGELTLNLTTFTLSTLDLSISGCSVLGSALNAVVSFFNTAIGNAIVNVVIGLLKPTLNSLIQSILPKPPGIAGTLAASGLLGSLNPPKDASLEMFVVAGGYVQGKAGGLTLGVMSGVNSDRDQTTRDATNSSEPSLCVPVRPTPVLSDAPWNLPINVARNDFSLNPAGPFSGDPDPTDAMGNTQDLAIGLSRTFLDLVGFHIFNSGTLCLDIDGSAIQQLNAGTLSVIVPSLSNILEDQTGPLKLVLRPQTPLTFTIGAGGKADPLIHVGISDLRIDFYAWIEERYVRLLTAAVDLNLGLDLASTMAADGKAAVQLTLSGLDSKNVTIRISNTDLLQDTPADLAAVFPSLINIAAGAIGGAIKPIELPSIAGFTLDNLSIQRVQTTQDDFVGIFAGIATGTPAPLVDWSDAAHPHLVGAVRTVAAISQVATPSAPQLRALFVPELGVTAARPMVRLALSAANANGRPLEYGWRIDSGMWHDWSQDPNPTLVEPEFLLQGHHTIEVRSRVVNHWETEDLVPVKLDALIDSMAPELHPARDEQNHSQLKLGGRDIVTPAAQLRYAWRALDGQRSAWSSLDTMSEGFANSLTNGGTAPLVLYAIDEAGNIGEGSFDLAGLGMHANGATATTSGCSFTGGHGDSEGGGTSGGLLAFAVLALVCLWRRARALAPLALVVAIGFGAAGCGHSSKNQCTVDDDCAKTTCPAGQIPTCGNKTCGCIPDVPLGDIGRFSSMAILGTDAYVAAYNNTYGDLMIGHITPPGDITNWDFVDGVPDETPDFPNSHVRGGVKDKGDDVGRYTSIGVSSTNDPVVAYYDLTHGALKFAEFGAIRWHSHTVDVGTGTPGTATGDDIGKWASLSVGLDGNPAIAYSAWVQNGVSGKPESQLRWAQAKVPYPQSSSDWTITVLDSRLQSSDGSPPDMGAPPADMATPSTDMAGAVDMAGTAAAPTPELLPEGIALMPSVARMADGTPGVTYYDRQRGNLRYVAFNNNMSAWGKPVILDGEDASGTDNGDVGIYNSLAYDENGIAHVSYENDAQNQLLYINLTDKARVVIDDGYHPTDEQTQDGLDSPVWHFVGDSSSIKTQAGRVVIAYQDSTVVELRMAVSDPTGKWTKQYIAGHAQPFTGAYGFYADLQMQGGGKGFVSSYAINQQMDIPQFYVEVFGVDLSIIQ
jgi:hypothetical protein